MPSGVYKRTEYHKLINSNGHKGLIPWNKGTKGLVVAWNKGMVGLPARHTTPHTEETKLKISLAKKGKSINRVKGVSEETRLCIRDALRRGNFTTCKMCGKEFFCSPSIIKRGRTYCSNKCQGLNFRGGNNPNWGKGLKGDKSPFWKGGINPINDSIRKSRKYRIWRRTVFIRDEFTCRKCKKTHIYIEAHHIKSFADYPELRFDINNGLTVCEECHSKTKNYKGNSKRRQ